MKMSTAGLIALVGHEGIVLSRYKDSVGVWTIGVGHTAAAGGINPATFTGTLTVAEAIGLLRIDIAKYEAAVDRAVNVILKQYEFDALVSFHYNTGAIAIATLTETLNSGDRKAAGAQFMNWLKPKEVKARRQAESTLFLTGVYPKPVATIYPATPAGDVMWSKGKVINVADILGDAPAADPAGDRVRWLQTRLTAHGFPCAIDGDLGPKTSAALAAFVAAKSIMPDVVDAATAAALNRDP